MAKRRVQAGDTADAQGQYHRNDNDDNNGENDGEYCTITGLMWLNRVHTWRNVKKPPRLP